MLKLYEWRVNILGSHDMSFLHLCRYACRLSPNISHLQTQCTIYYGILSNDPVIMTPSKLSPCQIEIMQARICRTWQWWAISLLQMFQTFVWDRLHFGQCFFNQTKHGFVFPHTLTAKTIGVVVLMILIFLTIKTSHPEKICRHYAISWQSVVGPFFFS